MAHSPSSPDATEAASERNRHRLLLRPLHGLGISKRARLSATAAPGQLSSDVTTIDPAGQRERAGALARAWLYRWRHYILALFFVAAAALVRGATGAMLNATPFLVFYLAWVGAAAFGGLGPGLLATMASWLCIDLFFDPGPGHVGFRDAASVGRFVIFGAGGLAVSLVGERMRRARLRTQRQAKELAAANVGLRESEGKYRFLVENSKDITWRMDLQGNWTFISSNVEPIAGYRVDEVIGKTLWDFLAPECHDFVKDKLTRRARGEDLPAYEVLMIGKDGRRIPFELWSVSLVDDRGNVVGVQGVSRDITERKRSEAALHELNATLESKVAQRTAELEHRARQLERLTRELSEAEERERSRLAEILHDDLQQVLAAAKFHLSRMAGGTESPAQRQEIMEQVTQMLKDAIEKSRSLSHELNPTVLHQDDFRETFDWLAEQMQAKHGLLVRLETFGELRVQSDTVKTFLYRSAQELLFNVVKHARVSEARLRVRRVGSYLCLSVSDRGHGFDAQKIGETAGFGLLAIQERVALLGGRMKTRSAFGRGTTFCIVVPDVEPPTSDAPVQQGPNGPRRATPRA